MRLIDGDELAEAFREMAYTEYRKENKTYWSEALISAAKEVDDAPTIDAVHVTRCEECLYSSPDDRHRYGRVKCAIFQNRSFDRKFFCLYGRGWNE